MCERVRVGALRQVMQDVWRKVMLRGVLLPVLDEVLERAAGFWVSVVCCAVEAGAVTYWRSAMYDRLAEQVGEVRDTGSADACLRAEGLQQYC